jgi:hypothetical protein
MNSRRSYIDAVQAAMTSAGFPPAHYSYITGHTQAWFQWVSGQRAVNSAAWPQGVYVSWHHTLGWHYSQDPDTDVRNPLPFTIGADPMDVADGVRRLLLGLTRDLPASMDDWANAAALTASQGAR